MKVGLIAIICLAMLAAGCGSKEEIPDKFDRDQVVKEAKTVIEQMNQGEYDKLVEERWDAAMKQGLSAAKMQEGIKPMLDELGAFDSFAGESVSGKKDKDTEQEFAVAVILGKYEKRKAQFTISFDTDMKVAGLFIK